MSGNQVEYETIQVGSAILVRSLLKKLGVVSAIDAALSAQPEIEATYGHLLQVIIVNRLTFDPQPLYRIGEWAQQHGIDQLFGIRPEWLDDDRLGAGLDAIAQHQVEIWINILKRAQKEYQLVFDDLHSDTTSVYFEGDFEGAAAASSQERIPELRIGYNKDGQNHKKQMVLSLINVGRIPIWFRPWNGNKSDDGVGLSDLKELGRQVLLPGNSLLIGDRKLCQQETMIECCWMNQYFLASHPWTPTAKQMWCETFAALEAGKQSWQELSYLSINEARKAPDKRVQYRVYEVVSQLEDPERGANYTLRRLFIHSSKMAAAAAQLRQTALEKGESALKRIARLLGKYQYRQRDFIEQRIREELRRAKAANYFTYTLSGTDGERDWRLQWERNEPAIAQAASFDGISLLCTNAPANALSSDDAWRKYKEQIGVEQAIDFIKSPVQIRPTWLHLPQRIAGLTLLVMIAVLIAMLLEFEVRKLLKEHKKQIKGLRPEGRKTPAPTAKSLLRAFNDYSLVVIKHIDGTAEVHYPKLKSVPQQIWDLLKLPPLSAETPRTG
jgi:transposase